MKRIVIFLLLHIALAGVVSAQVLYRISGNGARAHSYLLATNRLTEIPFLDTIPNLFACYGRTNKVITEFAMQDYEALAALRVASLLPDSVRLSAYYTEEEYKQLDEAFQLTVGMGMDKLCRMKPQYLTEMYRTELLKKWADYDEDKSSSHFFEAVASSQGKPVIGLDDTGESMWMLFDREPFHWQCEELKNVVEHPEREVKQEKMLRDLYKNGRLLDIAYQVSGPDNRSSISYSDYQIYCKRNKTWVKRLRPYLQEGSCFIVLDAMYLGGENGLIQQLRAAGYKVKPQNK